MKRLNIVVTALLVLLNTGVYLFQAIQAHAWTSIPLLNLLDLGGNAGPYTLGGEPWRLVASMAMHGGLMK